MRAVLNSCLTRRNAIQAGVLLIGFGLSLSRYLRLTSAEEAKSAKGKSAIVINLGGGPTHLDTFDLKPDAPAEFRGEFNPIDTNVAGIQISEHLPKLATCADKFAILRGVSHAIAGHELATSYLSTGSRPVPSLIYPGYGAVVSKELSGSADLPHFVAIPETPQKPGYLGVRYAPLRTNATPKAGTPFSVRGIALEDGQSIEQFQKRQKLLTQLDTTFEGQAANSKLLDGLDKFDQQAFDMISSPHAREAFDVSLEQPDVAQPFGETKFGMSCLLAMRLISAGVRFTTINFGGWDTHGNNFKSCKEGLLPSLDQGLSALFNTLAARGLLDSTTIFVTGEFGRTPKLNQRSPEGGRDHYPRCMFMVMAGGGIKGGQVLGESDDKATMPKNEGFS
ncbi:MAG: DUF1501 domain-containing protein, partial [Planctomycetaceae bacterium]|nr:DUF1501 domain-containing protein [Planctomycetaceae bacterium]